MYTRLEKIAYEIYVDFRKSEFCFTWHSIDYFISRKDSYKPYFDDATIKLRKEKIKKLNKST